MGLSSLGGNEWIHMEDNIKRAFALLGFCSRSFWVCTVQSKLPATPQHHTDESRYREEKEKILEKMMYVQ
jgi:hypothetical protein